METCDLVAIVVVIACGLLGASGLFRWASGLLVGLLIGGLILGVFSVVGSYSWGRPIGTFFEEGTLVPFVGQRIEEFRKGGTRPTRTETQRSLPVDEDAAPELRSPQREYGGVAWAERSRRP